MKVTNNLESTLDFSHTFMAFKWKMLSSTMVSTVSPNAFFIQVSSGRIASKSYHKHSDPLGVEAHNMMKAPLIVHPNSTAESKVLVDRLNNRDELLVNPRYGIMNVFSSFQMNL